MARSLAIRLAAVPLLAPLLLGPAPASAQLLGDLAKLSPEEIAADIKKSAPKVAGAIADTGFKDLASQVLSPGEPKKLADALSATTPREAAAAIAKAAEVAEELKEAGAQRATGAEAPATAPAPAAAAGPPAAAGPAGKGSPEAKVADALQAVDEALQEATRSLNGTGSAPEALDKAKAGLAKVAIEAGPQVQAIGEAGKGLAEALAPSVKEAIEKAAPQVEEKVREVAERTRPEDVHRDAKAVEAGILQKVQEAIGFGDQKIQEFLRGSLGGDKAPPARPADAKRRGAAGAPWFLMGTLLVGLAAVGAGVFGGRRLRKRREARSPGLLMESELTTDGLYSRGA